MSAISLKLPAPVRERSQDGGSTSGRDAVRSLFTGDVRGTAITSHRGWPVSGDVEGHTKQRVGIYDLKPGLGDLSGNMIYCTETSLFHINEFDFIF